MHLHLEQAKVFITKENNLRHNHFIQRKYTCSFVHEVVKHLNAMETLRQVPGKNLMTHSLKTLCLPTLSQSTLYWFTHTYTHQLQNIWTFTEGHPQKRARERAQSRSEATTYQSRFSCNPKRDTEKRKNENKNNTPCLPVKPLRSGHTCLAWHQLSQLFKAASLRF